MIIKESIQHGDFHQVRTIEITSLTMNTLKEFLKDSPYNSNLSGNALHDLYESLKETSEGSLGWADYVII